jgi:hypothetical protein
MRCLFHVELVYIVENRLEKLFKGLGKVPKSSLQIRDTVLVGEAVKERLHNKIHPEEYTTRGINNVIKD